MPCCLVALLFSFPFGTAAAFFNAVTPAGRQQQNRRTQPEMAVDPDDAISTLMLEKDPLLHWARRLLPERRQRAASALYAWCRRLDEIADEPGADRAATLQRLDLWSRKLDGIWAGQPSDAFDTALVNTLAEYPSLSRQPFDAMLAGMVTDVSAAGLRVRNFRPELLTYCYRVAGTVGEMLLPVLGLEEDQDGSVAECAIALGCAVQLLNIMRDTRDDLLLRDRIYLPATDAERCGVGDGPMAQSEVALENTIRSAHLTPAYRRLVRLQGLRAAALLSRAETALPRVPRAPAILIAVLIELHRALLQALRARGYDNLSGDRVRVSSTSKLWITLRTTARVLLASTPEARVRLRAR